MKRRPPALGPLIGLRAWLLRNPEVASLLVLVCVVGCVVLAAILAP